MEEEFNTLLKEVKFEKYLKKLNKKLKNKSVLIYGAGSFFQYIQKNYDLANLNIVGISDKKYTPENDTKEDLGYKVVPYDELDNVEVDYILVSVLKFLPILFNFRYKKFKDKKIKVLPLVDKPFLTLLKEMF